MCKAYTHVGTCLVAKILVLRLIQDVWLGLLTRRTLLWKATQIYCFWVANYSWDVSPPFVKCSLFDSCRSHLAEHDVKLSKFLQQDAFVRCLNGIAKWENQKEHVHPRNEVFFLPTYFAQNHFKCAFLSCSYFILISIVRQRRQGLFLKHRSSKNWMISHFEFHPPIRDWKAWIHREIPRWSSNVQESGATYQYLVFEFPESNSLCQFHQDSSKRTSADAHCNAFRIEVPAAQPQRCAIIYLTWLLRSWKTIVTHIPEVSSHWNHCPLRWGPFHGDSLILQDYSWFSVTADFSWKRFTKVGLCACLLWYIWLSGPD